MRQEYALLDESGNVIPATLLEWARWMEGNRHRVIEQIELPGDIKVSTVFLGLDHQYALHGPPLWFETMVFGPERTEYSKLLGRDWTYRPELGYCERYTTLQQAKAGHDEAVQWAITNAVRAGITDDVSL